MENDQPQKNEKKAAAGRKGGQIGGKATTEAKQQASRANGKAYGGSKNGGRPKGTSITTEHAQKAAAARAAKLTPERRREIALKAVAAREAKRKEKGTQP